MVTIIKKNKNYKPANSFKCTKCKSTIGYDDLDDCLKGVKEFPTIIKCPVCGGYNDVAKEEKNNTK